MPPKKAGKRSSKLNSAALPPQYRIDWLIKKFSRITGRLSHGGIVAAKGNPKVICLPKGSLVHPDDAWEARVACI